MTEPTQEQKLEAAQAALAAMDPPRTEEDIAPNTLEAVVTVVWSQLALVPAAAGAAEPDPMFAEWLTTPNPVLQARVRKLNADAAVLAAEIRADNLSGGRAT